eukprot:TRINITY_DN72116_c0_g1_i1.p1 TRINITY_DN72116_c0_g1~~TRINITY_DN72116_c0_g1_i1.p1  ORF type:complete len:117 (+),score=5.83 TRINITY_DN72116_c0_g1_i1:1-351(+)
MDLIDVSQSYSEDDIATMIINNPDILRTPIVYLEDEIFIADDIMDINKIEELAHQNIISLQHQIIYNPLNSVLFAQRWIEFLWVFYQNKNAKQKNNKKKKKRKRSNKNERETMKKG